MFYDSAGKEVYRNAITLRHGTNNSAEYYAAIYALNTALNLGIVNAQLYSDSELLVKQFNGAFKVNENLKPYYMEMCRLSETFDKVTVEWIPNSLNKIADRLAKQAIRPQEGGSSEVMQQDRIVVKESNDVPKMRQKTLLDFCKKPVVVSKVNEIPIEKIRPGELDATATKIILTNTKGVTEETKEQRWIESSPIQRDPKIEEEMQLEVSRIGDSQKDPTIINRFMLHGEAKEGKTLTNHSDRSLSMALRESFQRKGAGCERSFGNWSIQYKERLAEEILNDHEGKLLLLGDYKLQVIEKVQELAFTWEEMRNYGANTLEPWRDGISDTVGIILKGAEVLEKTVGDIYDGCTNLEARINRLESDLHQTMR